MSGQRDARSAIAVVASAAGVGFSSGREIVIFFSQMGHASWIGVLFASLMFGLFCGIVCHFAHRTGAGSFAAVYEGVLGNRQGAIVGTLHCLLMALTIGAMLVAAGELGALALPMKNAFLMGVLLAISLALALNVRALKALGVFGAVVIAVCILFHLALALDRREVVIFKSYETEALLNNSVTAAILLASLHAALSASVAGGVTVCYQRRIDNEWRFAGMCAGFMLAVLASANIAILSAGEKAFSLTLPTVVLAARWGVAGYYIAIVVMWLCAVTTLAAAIGALVARTGDGHRQRKYLAAAMVAGFGCAAVLGFERFIEIGYPMLGWACVFSLAGLACYYDKTEIRNRGNKAKKQVLNYEKSIAK